MANETSNVLKTSAWLMVSRTIPTLALLAVNMWYARKLDYYDYASYQSLWLWVNALTLFGTLGLPKYLLTFGTGYQLFKEHKKLKLGVIGVVVVGIGFWISPFCCVLSFPQMLLLLAVILVQIIALINESLLLHAHRNRRIMFSSLVFSCCFLAGHYIVVMMDFSLTSWLTMMVLAGTIRLVMMHTSIPFEPCDSEKPAELKWIATNDALQFITKWFDKMILVYLLSPKEYSIYFNGTNEIPFTGVLIAAYGAAFSVHTARSGSSSQQTQLFRKSAGAFSAILFPLFGLCLFFPQEIVTTLFGEQYVSSANLFSLMALIIPLRIAAYTPMLQQQGKGKTIIEGAILDLMMAIALMLILYPLASVYGIAIAVVVATYCQVIYYIHHILRVYRVPITELFDLKLLGARLIMMVLAFALLRCMLWEHVDSLSFISCLLLFAAMAAYYFFIEWRKQQQMITDGH